MAGREDDAAHCLDLADHTGDCRGGHDAILTNHKMADLKKRAQTHQGVNTQVKPQGQMQSSESTSQARTKAGTSLWSPTSGRPYVPGLCSVMQHHDQAVTECRAADNSQAPGSQEEPSLQTFPSVFSKNVDKWRLCVILSWCNSSQQKTRPVRLQW